MSLKKLYSVIGLSISIFLTGCGSNIEGEENLPIVCLEYKDKGQELFQPFPNMLADFEQAMIDINNGLLDTTPEKRVFIIERCTTLLADLKKTEREASSGSSIIQAF